jgi:hypothetical protein
MKGFPFFSVVQQTSMQIRFVRASRHRPSLHTSSPSVSRMGCLSRTTMRKYLPRLESQTDVEYNAYPPSQKCALQGLARRRLRPWGT